MKKSKEENCKSVIKRITTEMKDKEKRLVRFMKIEFQIGWKYFQWPNLDLNYLSRNSHCLKSVHIRSFSNPNVGKYGPEKLRIRTLFTQRSVWDSVKLWEISNLLITCPCKVNLVFNIGWVAENVALYLYDIVIYEMHQIYQTCARTLQLNLN